MFISGDRQRVISQQGTEAFMRTVERSSARSFRAKVAAYFLAHPREWISSEVLMGIGGRMAWRTRVSEVRTDMGLDIVNRTRKVGQVTVSEYKYQPPSLPIPAQLEMSL